MKNLFNKRLSTEFALQTSRIKRDNDKEAKLFFYEIAESSPATTTKMFFVQKAYESA